MIVNGIELKPGANLRRAGLNRRDLAGVDLCSADLRCADISSSKLVRAQLRDADLNFADLQGADLTSADLSRANLSFADLTGANLTDIIINGANLYAAIGIIILGSPGGWHAHAWLRDGILSIRIGCREFRYHEAMTYWNNHPKGRENRLEQLAATEYACQIALARGWRIE